MDENKATVKKRSASKRPKKKSSGEEMFWFHCRAMNIPLPQREFAFYPTRRWRFDFAWPELKICVEVEGVVGDGIGRHQTAKGFESDCEKYNQAVLLGWKLLRFTQSQIKSLMAIEQTIALLKSESEKV